SGGRLQIATGGGSTFTFPTPSASLTINAGAGNDSITPTLTSLAPKLFIDGQAGTDSVTITGGSYTSLGYSVENISDTATTAERIFGGTDGNDEINVN